MTPPCPSLRFSALILLGIATAPFLSLSLGAGVPEAEVGPSSLQKAWEGAAPSGNATVNLIRLLVERGILTREEAGGLIRQAEEEARVASQARSADPSPERSGAAVEAVGTPGPATARVSTEGVSWTSRIKPSGDLRLRLETVSFPSGNEARVDFNAINTGSPFNLAGSARPPMLNTDTDRVRPRLRARFGLEATLADSFTLGGRIATGSGTSPVSTNQTLGSPPNFSRYAIWLDRAFLRWEQSLPAEVKMSAWGGRFSTPFFGSDFVWDSDLGFDGLAVQAKRPLGESLEAWLTLGAFPIFNTTFNFPTTHTSKYSSEDRYLYSAQVGLDFRPNRELRWRTGLAYHDFAGIQGRLSEAYVPLSASDPGSTDLRRPGFAQSGNTYMELRAIRPDPANQDGRTHQWQYFGLASPFRVLSLSTQLDWNPGPQWQVSLVGEGVRNLAYDAATMDRTAFNNRPVSAPGSPPGTHLGGGDAWIVGLEGGRPKLEARWDWRIGVDYRHIESDAMVDAFVDSDFGLGGTNVRGFTLRGLLAFNRHVHASLRWLRSCEVDGPRFRSSIVQIDLNTRF